MRAEVNQDTCIGCALCTSVCPNVFYMKDNGKADTSPLPHAEQGMNDARDFCPVGAISIHEE